MSWLDTSYITDSHKRTELLFDDSLSQEQLNTATTQNVYWWHQLADDWAGDQVSKADPDSARFADDIRQWQLSNTGFEPDGICGPKTNKAIQADVFEAPPGKDYFLINGVRVDSEGLRVVTPDEPGALVFDQGFYDAPLLDPDLFVVHWDGCMDSHQCFDVLRSRKLSVLFMEDCDATVWQGVDPAHATCWHAGRVNRRAWGVEIANPVLPERNKRCQPPRPLTKMFVRGDMHEVLDFYPVQLQGLVKLLDWVCDYTKLPRQLPAYKGKLGDFGPPEIWKSVANSYFPPTGDKWNVGGFKGICGHYHQDNNKCDPGMYTVWQYVLENLPGCRVVEVA